MFSSIEYEEGLGVTRLVVVAPLNTKNSDALMVKVGFWRVGIQQATDKCRRLWCLFYVVRKSTWCRVDK